MLVNLATPSMIINLCIQYPATGLISEFAGAGYGSALYFAKRGARVILACRSEKSATSAKERIIKLTQNHNIVVKYVDFSSLKTVRDFARDITQTEERVDILVNNVGAITSSDKVTVDGFPEAMQVNYYAHVLLTIHLIGKYSKTNYYVILSLHKFNQAMKNIFSPENAHLMIETRVGVFIQWLHILFIPSLSIKYHSNEFCY